MNSNIADCFEKVSDSVESVNINAIIDKINSDFIDRAEEEPIKSRVNRYKEGTRYSIK